MGIPEIFNVYKKCIQVKMNNGAVLGKHDRSLSSKILILLVYAK
jgi:hypothetical protein